jgi:hypothetical protein
LCSIASTLLVAVTFHRSLLLTMGYDSKPSVLSVALFLGFAFLNFLAFLITMCVMIVQTRGFVSEMAIPAVVLYVIFRVGVSVYFIWGQIGAINIFK